MFVLAELSLCILSEFKGTEESQEATQQIIGSPVAKRQPAIKGKKHDHWFLVLGGGLQPPCEGVCVCMLVLRALVLCIVLKENWLPPEYSQHLCVTPPDGRQFRAGL